MGWTKPEVTEVPLAMEVTNYANVGTEGTVNK